MRKHIVQHPQKFIVFMQITRKFTAILRHAAEPLLDFPQNVIYLKLLFVSVENCILNFIYYIYNIVYYIYCIIIIIFIYFIY
jgi:hypothetical protein